MKNFYLAIALLATFTLTEVRGQNSFPTNGSVGIGTTSPTYPFHMKNASNSTRARFQFGPAIIDLVTYPAGSMAYSNSSGMFVSHQDGLLMVGNNKDLRFVTFPGSYVEMMRIKANGNVGIGTINPANKLEVNGTIRAKEIKLEAANWPDYVFEAGYKLMPLEEVSVYINQHGHLPGLKSAREYEAEGVNMLELNQKLLEKVEELTLYMILQDTMFKDVLRKLDSMKGASPLR